MKIQLIALIALITLLTTSHATAQYRRSSGIDRMDNSRYAAPKEKEPYDYVKASTEKMTKELSLDGFQAAVIKTILEDFQAKYATISQEQIPNDGKAEKMRIETLKMETKISDILNADQKVKFEKMKDKAEKGKKKKGKREETEATEPLSE